MKKVLIITYYWPPAGGVAVQRWLKFVKYLPELGWKPIVFHPENPDYPISDSSLAKDIPKEAEFIKLKIFEPFAWYKRFLGLSQDQKIQQNLTGIDADNWKQNIAMWVRANVFIPDARCFWINPSYRRLNKYLQDNPVDWIVSNGTPHSTHLIALKLKKKHPHIKWLADFRDPWTGIDYFESLPLTPWAKRRHKKLEKKVITTADIVQTVSSTWGREFEAIGAKKVSIITNGFDQSDFDGLVANQPKDKTVIAHLGTLNAERNPISSWRKLSNTKFDKPLEIRLIGKVAPEVIKSLKEFGLWGRTKVIDQMPYKEALQEMFNAHILLLCVSDTKDIGGRTPAKAFEYLAANKPIILDNENAKDLIEIIGKNRITDYSKIDKLLSTNYSKFSRLELTNKLVELMND
ncbi:MAG: glycosyltransferase involved in cell wall biosynthesis [Sphingobacteriales bacterium]|jgi:glycosyltransferase involved in cell wall biosynthesis